MISNFCKFSGLQPQISKVFLDDYYIFFHRRSEQFWKQNTSCKKKVCLQFISGVFLLPNDSIQEVYDGIWGYSSILSMCALSCVFFALSQMSVVLALVNVLGTIGVQYGLRTTLSIQV